MSTCSKIEPYVCILVGYDRHFILICRISYNSFFYVYMIFNCITTQIQNRNYNYKCRHSPGLYSSKTSMNLLQEFYLGNFFKRFSSDYFQILNPLRSECIEYIFILLQLMCSNSVLLLQLILFRSIIKPAT